MTAPLRPKKKGNWIVWSVLGLLALSLTGFGVGSVGRSGSQAVATVGGEKVTANEYARALNARLQDLSRQTGTNFTLEQARQFGIDRQVLGQVLATAALNAEDRRLGLSIGDTRVRDALLANRAFQDMTGKFDEQTYKSILRRINMKPAEYETTLRQDNARAILQTAITGGIHAGDSYALAMLRFVREERIFSWGRVTTAMLDGPTRAPTEAEIKAWYKDHPKDYTSPRTRRITYVYLTPDMMTDKVKVDDATLRAEYEKQSERFNTPARRVVDRLVFANQAEATAARQAIDSGSKTFEDVVRERGLEPKDVALGEIRESDLSLAAGKAVFGTDKPGIVGPVESTLGPALFRIRAVLAARSVPFEKARPTLLAEYVAARARAQVEKEMPRIDDMLAGGADLEDVARETPAKLGKIDFTARSKDGIARYEEFRKEAAAVTTDDYPTVKVASDGTVFALRLDKIIEPALIPLDKLRIRVIADWKADETRRRLRELADRIKGRIDSGTPFAEAGLADVRTEQQRRDAKVKDAPGDLITRVFGMKPEETAVVADGDNVAVLRLGRIIPFDAKTPDNAKLVTQVTDQYSQQVGVDVYQAYAAAIETTQGVTINQAVIDAVHSSFR